MDPARTESLSVLPKFKGDRKFEASRRLIEMEGGKRVLGSVSVREHMREDSAFTRMFQH